MQRAIDTSPDTKKLPIGVCFQAENGTLAGGLRPIIRKTRNGGMLVKRRLSWLLIAAMLVSLGAGVPAMAERTLATAKTPLYGASSAKISNIEQACEAINGTTVYDDGSFFSFNDTVGPRTASYGYRSAPNGRGVKVLGGGVAQAASTLYLALKKLDGIDYDEKSTYGSKFVEDYVDSSRDAILVDYKAGTDFSFYNNGDTSFRIDMWVSDEYVHCSLISPYGGGGESGEGFASIYLNGTSALVDNVTLAAESINDTTLGYRDVFSFNDVVGPRTERYGYRNAVNGRGVKVCGGGVAQVASALYLAIQDMDCITVLEKTTYGRNYNQDYVDDPDDAIVTDYVNGLDFSFRYTGRDSLSIYTYVEDDTLYCEAVEY